MGNSQIGLLLAMIFDMPFRKPLGGLRELCLGAILVPTRLSPSIRDASRLDVGSAQNQWPAPPVGSEDSLSDYGRDVVATVPEAKAKCCHWTTFQSWSYKWLETFHVPLEAAIQLSNPAQAV